MNRQRELIRSYGYELLGFTITHRVNIRKIHNVLKKIHHLIQKKMDLFDMNLWKDFVKKRKH